MALAIAIIPVGFEAAAQALAGIKNGAPRAISDAINRGLVTGRKVGVQLIRQRYNIKSGDLKSEGFVIKKASWGGLGGSLEAKGPMLPVSLFAPKVKIKRVVRRGASRQFVTVSIIRGNRKLVKGAFMAGGRVMERRQPEKYPIFPVSTIGVPFMAGQQGISEAIQTAIATAVESRLASNIDRFTRGVVGEAKVRQAAGAALVGSKVAT